MESAVRSDYSFALPAESIAQLPADQRDASRLLVLPRHDGPLAHRNFMDLPDLLLPGDLVVVNDTRVLQARVELFRASGGRIPGLLVERPQMPSFTAMLAGKGKLREGDELVLEGQRFRLELALGDGLWRVGAENEDALRVLLACGRMPLPPYIHRERGSDVRDAVDRERYQTVFAAAEGAVAAPTAGLHFTPVIVERLRARGIAIATITLHVGPGTFLPVRVERLDEHRMHREAFAVPAETAGRIAATRAAGGRVVAVGTTVVRTLEAVAARHGEVVADEGFTDLFIRPPYAFRVVDALVTNFHLPESTLLMLVAAFCQRVRLLDAYRIAVEQGYRFFSYGDAMLITPANAAAAASRPRGGTR